MMLHKDRAWPRLGSVMESNVVVLVVAILALLHSPTHESATSKLQERFWWRQLDYAFPDAASRQQALRTGEFVPENNLPVGIEIWNDKLFVTVPRWRQGIPSTLNYIPLSVAPSDSPALIPYPDFAYNREGNCQGLTTTYRVKVDACDRLWVLDSGTVGIGNTTEQVCPYALHVFDLRTDRPLRRYQFRTEDTNADTFIANLAVDLGHSCDDAFAYASDELGYGLIVYSWELNTSWRLEHPFLMPDPLRGDYNVAGLNFQWGEEGVFGLALTAPLSDGFRMLLFHPLSSHREFAVSTRVLRDRALGTGPPERYYHMFTALPERTDVGGHVTASFLDEPSGVLFYNLVDRNAVGCWDSRRPHLPEEHGVVDRDDVGLVFPSDVRVDRHRTLWVISDRMPVFLIAGTLDFNDINFRIFNAPVDVALAGTVCQPHLEGTLPATAPAHNYVHYGK